MSKTIEKSQLIAQPMNDEFDKYAKIYPEVFEQAFN